MPIVTIDVYDKQTQRPIPYVSVMMGNTVGATDPNGRVKFNVPVGTYNISVRSNFYRPFTANGQQITADTGFRVEVERAIVI